uniref:Uncharacterized protein n=1 Tax=Anguilla anguilla TaxID=7936 RepID=A0A0E9Q8V2_ANGAN
MQKTGKGKILKCTYLYVDVYIHLYVYAHIHI